MPGPTFEQLKEGMERIGGSMHQSRTDAQGLAAAFHQFAADALPLYAQFKALNVVFRGFGGVFKEASATMQVSAAGLRRQWSEQRAAIVEAFHAGQIKTSQAVELLVEMRKMKGLQDAKVAAAEKFASSSKLAVKYLELAVIQGGVLATEFFALNQSLIKANSAIQHRNDLMYAGLETTVRTGALFTDVLDAQHALVDVGADMADNYKDTLETTIMLHKGLGMSTVQAAQLAVVVQYQVGASFERVANTVTNIVNQTALAADEAGRMATELGRIMSMIRGTQGAAILPDLLKVVGKYEDALKRIGGQAGGITELVKKLSGPTGFGMAGVLGVASPEILATEQGVETMMRSLAMLGDNLVGRAQGWQRRMGLEVLSQMLGVTAEQANELYLAAKRANSGIAEELTLRERYQQQTANLVDGLKLLLSRVISVLEMGLMPFIRLLSGLVDLLNRGATWLAQYKLVVDVFGTLAMVAVPVAVIALLGLIRTLYRVAVATAAAKLGLEPGKAGLMDIMGLRSSLVSFGTALQKFTYGSGMSTWAMRMGGPLLPGTGGMTSMSGISRILGSIFVNALRLALLNPIGLAITALISIGLTLWKIKSINEQAQADKKAADLKHAAGLMDLHERRREQLYFSVRSGHFDNTQKQIAATLSAYGASLASRGIAKESKEFADLMTTKANELAQDMRVAAVTSTQFKEEMTPADEKMFDAQLAVAKAARESGDKMAKTYKEQGEREREQRDKEKQEADMKWYNLKHIFNKDMFSVGSFGQFWHNLTQ